jgi:hypothetical protein
MGFRPLQHLQGSEVHITRTSQVRFVPPSGFGYPPGGFLPPRPGRLCFAPAALLGFALRSFLPSQGASASPPKRAHLPFSPTLHTRRKPASHRIGLRLLGFDPCQDPSLAGALLTRRQPDAPLGFSLPGQSNGSLDPGFARVSSRVLGVGRPEGHPSPHLGVSISRHLASTESNG